MKTPRQILLDRLREAEPQLDAIRRAALGAVLKVRSGTGPTQESWERGGRRGPLAVLWQELILPVRRVWIGLAAAWLITLLLNLSAADKTRIALSAAPLSQEEIRMTMGAARCLISPWTEPMETGPVAPPKAVVPQPRSQWQPRAAAG